MQEQTDPKHGLMDMRGKVMAKFVASMTREEGFIPVIVVGQRIGEDSMMAIGPGDNFASLTPVQREWLKSQWHMLGHLILGEAPCEDDI